MSELLRDRTQRPKCFDHPMFPASLEKPWPHIIVLFLILPLIIGKLLEDSVHLREVRCLGVG
jgi:hypothetical protein